MKPAALVIDASVAVKMFIEEDESDLAEALLAGARNQEVALLVPELLFAECANVLWKYARRTKMAPSEVDQRAGVFLKIAFESVPVKGLLVSAIQLASAADISVYDALYAVLARDRKLPLVSADEKLLNKLIGHKIDAYSLGNALALLKESSKEE